MIHGGAHYSRLDFRLGLIHPPSTPEVLLLRLSLNPSHGG